MDALYIIAVAFVVIIYLILLGIGIADYIIMALGLSRLATKRGLSKAWIAWVPIANSWTFGNIVDEFESEKGSKRKFRVILLALEIVMIMLVILMLTVFVECLAELSIYGDYLTSEDMIEAFVLIYSVAIPASLLSVAYGAIALICLYKIHEYVYPEKAIKYIIVSLLVPLGASICLFRNANRCEKKQVIGVGDTVIEFQPEISAKGQEDQTEE